MLILGGVHRYKLFFGEGIVDCRGACLVDKFGGQQIFEVEEAEDSRGSRITTLFQRQRALDRIMLVFLRYAKAKE